MYKPDTGQERLQSGLTRLERLYAHYEKALNCAHFSIYYETLHTLNKIEHKIARYQDKLKRGAPCIK